jgi:cytochrome c oxidase cbb3-type subunit 3
MHMLLVCLAILMLGACEREARRFDAQAAIPERNAFDLAQGKRLYRWYNCAGCHSTAGGGNMGPPLSDDKWRYGDSLADVIASIQQGRPNGMPAFAGRIPDDQMRQIAAYVRSLSGQLHADTAPSRTDSMWTNEPESRRDRETPRADPAVPGAKP